jgi:hypothetical protein
MTIRALAFTMFLALIASACAAPAASPSPTVKPLAVITITQPAAGATVAAGDVTVTYDVSDVVLVPAASAQKPEDYHLHAVLDLDTSAWVGTSVAVPAGSANPNPARVIHTAAKSVTFTNVTAGDHTVTVWLSLSTHTSVLPAVFSTRKFTVR